MAVVVVPVNNYIKKEDALKSFKSVRPIAVGMSVFYMILSWFMFFAFPPRTLMVNEGVISTQYILLRSLVLFISPFVFMVIYLPVVFSKNYEKRYFDSLKKYKSGEMISVNKIAGNSSHAKAMLFYMLALGIGAVLYLVKIF
jgi:hypothetical protein